MEDEIFTHLVKLPDGSECYYAKGEPLPLGAFVIRDRRRPPPGLLLPPGEDGQEEVPLAEQEIAEMIKKTKGPTWFQQ